MDFLFLVIGFVFLIKGADLLVGSASKIAKIMGIPAFIVGLSVVAFGTSAPEAAIGIFSGIKHTNQISLGNVIGSSIVNIALVIGLTSVLIPIKVEKTIILREMPFLLAVQLLLLVMVLTGSDISRIDGAILLAVFSLFVWYISVKSRRYANSDDKESCGAEDLKDGCSNEDFKRPDSEHRKIILKLVGILIAGLALLVWGGNIVVESSVGIAHMFGLSETLIGLTIVSLGTCLPEMVTSVIAAFRKEESIAVGNIIGSNIFNITYVLGTSALIYPIKSAGVELDIAAMILSTVAFFTLAYFRQSITRPWGIMLILFYIIFIIYKV